MCRAVKVGGVLKFTFFYRKFNIIEAHVEIANIIIATNVLLIYKTLSVNAIFKLKMAAKIQYGAQNSTWRPNFNMASRNIFIQYQ